MVRTRQNNNQQKQSVGENGERVVKGVKNDDFESDSSSASSVTVHDKEKGGIKLIIKFNRNTADQQTNELDNSDMGRARGSRGPTRGPINQVSTGGKGSVSKRSVSAVISTSPFKVTCTNDEQNSDKLQQTETKKNQAAQVSENIKNEQGKGSKPKKALPSNKKLDKNRPDDNLSLLNTSIDLKQQQKLDRSSVKVNESKGKKKNALLGSISQYISSEDEIKQPSIITDVSGTKRKREHSLSDSKPGPLSKKKKQETTTAVHQASSSTAMVKLKTLNIGLVDIMKRPSANKVTVKKGEITAPPNILGTDSSGVKAVQQIPSEKNEEPKFPLKHSVVKTKLDIASKKIENRELISKEKVIRTETSRPTSQSKISPKPSGKVNVPLARVDKPLPHAGNESSIQDATKIKTRVDNNTPVKSTKKLTAVDVQSKTDSLSASEVVVKQVPRRSGSTFLQEAKGQPLKKNATGGGGGKVSSSNREEKHLALPSKTSSPVPQKDKNATAQQLVKSTKTSQMSLESPSKVVPVSVQPERSVILSKVNTGASKNKPALVSQTQAVKVHTKQDSSKQNTAATKEQGKNVSLQKIVSAKKMKSEVAVSEDRGVISASRISAYAVQEAKARGVSLSAKETPQKSKISTAESKTNKCNVQQNVSQKSVKPTEPLNRPVSQTGFVPTKIVTVKPQKGAVGKPTTPTIKHPVSKSTPGMIQSVKSAVLQMKTPAVKSVLPLSAANTLCINTTSVQGTKVIVVSAKTSATVTGVKNVTPAGSNTSKPKSSVETLLKQLKTSAGTLESDVTGKKQPVLKEEAPPTKRAKIIEEKPKVAGPQNKIAGTATLETVSSPPTKTAKIMEEESKVVGPQNKVEGTATSETVSSQPTKTAKIVEEEPKVAGTATSETVSIVKPVAAKPIEIQCSDRTEFRKTKEDPVPKQGTSNESLESNVVKESVSIPELVKDKVSATSATSCEKLMQAPASAAEKVSVQDKIQDNSGSALETIVEQSATKSAASSSDIGKESIASEISPIIRKSDLSTDVSRTNNNLSVVASSSSVPEPASSTVSGPEVSIITKPQSLNKENHKRDVWKPFPKAPKPPGFVEPPRGKPKSGRIWKSTKKRASTAIASKGVRIPLHQRIILQDQMKSAKLYQRQLLAEKAERLKGARERRELNKKRREENARKAEVVQVIRNTSKLRRMKRKQLRSIEKRDTTKIIPLKS